ncbi:hypothetical protein GQR60_03770 [Labilibaculum sp. A4]|uniref:hypothetical protein n=1 Tax=Labilibaculum euxinus TaxID=2686357 RepID=UPI000F622051|nr:hypothetical protein [Labilibaculum euxinus]MDQ1770329.1 hypothetical protein [Labilibaculum euxinus]MWN75452.1 hypothetical protein [Labilibaculum euxinus]
MELKKLLDPFPVKEEARLVARSIAENPTYIKELWDICISNENHSWRATWILDKVYDIAPDLVRLYLPQMIEIVPTLSNESKLRQYLKLISLEPLPSNISGDFINYCFDTLISSTSAIAIKVYAMQILYNFSLQEPDIQNELALVIEEQMENGSAGYCSRARRILKAIN